MEIISSCNYMLYSPWNIIFTYLFGIGIFGLSFGAIGAVLTSLIKKLKKYSMVAFILLIIGGVGIIGGGIVGLCGPHYCTYTVDTSDFNRDIPDIYEIIEQKSEHVYVIKLKENN